MEIDENSFELREGSDERYQIKVTRLQHGKNHPVATVYWLKDGAMSEVGCAKTADQATQDVVVGLNRRFPGKIVIK